MPKSNKVAIKRGNNVSTECCECNFHLEAATEKLLTIKIKMHEKVKHGRDNKDLRKISGETVNYFNSNANNAKTLNGNKNREQMRKKHLEESIKINVELALKEMLI